MAVTTRVAESLADPEIARSAEIMFAVVDGGASVGYLPPLEMETARAYWRDVCQPDVVLFLAEIDGEIVGTVQQLECARKQNGWHRAEVNRLLVDPAFQRRGIGLVLMDRLEAHARTFGRTLLHLDTREGDSSNDFYRSLGWIEVGTIPRWARSAVGTLDGTTFYYKVLSKGSSSMTKPSSLD